MALQSAFKPADTDHPIYELIAQRWSPRAFRDEPVDDEILCALFEAARWAPSSGNSQPWHFIVARRHADPDGFARLASTLMPGNDVWAARAPVLVLTVAREQSEKSGKPQPHAWHDVGMATYAFFMEVTARGLHAHPMAGFYADKARELCGIPEQHAPVAMIALGHFGDVEGLPEDIQKREAAPRVRKPLKDFLHEGVFAAQATFLPTRLP